MLQLSPKIRFSSQSEKSGKSDYEIIPNNKISYVIKLQVVTMYCTENIT